MSIVKEHPIGVVFAGGCQFWALAAVPLSAEDGSPINGFAWRCVHDAPQKNGLYSAPFAIVGGAFISGNAVGNIPDYVEIELPDEEEDVEITDDAEEQILLDAMYSDMQSMVETFIHSDETDEEI